MSYDLLLRFTSATSRARLEQFLRRRGRYEITKSQAIYWNKDTGVRFIFGFGASGLERLTGRVGELHFNLNYARPSFFALEADIELTALSAAFPLKIYDAQFDRLSDGPYNSEGFVDGWNQANAWAIGAMRAQGHLQGIHASPGEVLRQVWDWNYRCAQRRRQVGATQFLPTIVLGLLDGKVGRLALWPRNLAVQLPRVDYVVVSEAMGLSASDRDRLACWDTLVEAAARSGIETDGPTLDLREDPALTPLARLLASLPAFDRKRMSLVAFDKVLDRDVLEAGEREPGRA